MLPFNIASYALLAHIIGKMTNMIPKGIIGDLSNVHIYEPHLDAVTEQLSRDVNKYKAGDVEIQALNMDIDKLKISDFVFGHNGHYPAIAAEMLPYNN